MNLLGWLAVFFGSMAVSFVLGRTSDYQRSRWKFRSSSAVVLVSLTLLEAVVVVVTVVLALLLLGPALDSFVLAIVTGLFALGAFDLMSFARNLVALGPAGTYLLNRFRPSK